MAQPDLQTGELEIVEGFLSAVAESESASELCRHLVHSDSTNEDTIGAQLLWLNLNAELVPVASYGNVPNEMSYSLWSDTTPAKALRSKEATVDCTKISPARCVTALPLIHDKVPVGCLLLSTNSGPAIDTNSPNAIRILGRIGAYYLQMNGIANSQNKGDAVLAPVEPQTLTPRQKKILEFLATGMTNVEIARELLLSESSIRQETVRIFRALGVKNRAAAAKKAKALGIISGPVAPELRGA